MVEEEENESDNGVKIKKADVPLFLVFCGTSKSLVSMRHGAT